MTIGYQKKANLTPLEKLKKQVYELDIEIGGFPEQAVEPPNASYAVKCAIIHYNTLVADPNIKQKLIDLRANLQAKIVELEK